MWLPSVLISIVCAQRLVDNEVEYITPDEEVPESYLELDKESTVLMCMYLRDDVVQTVQTGKASCSRFAAERVFYNDDYLNICMQVALPYYITNGGASIRCSQHESKLRRLERTYKRALESLACDTAVTSLSSFYVMLKEIWKAVATGYVRSLESARRVDGRNSDTIEDLYQRQCYNSYHYVRFTPTMSVKDYWQRFADGMQNHITNYKAFTRMKCRWQINGAVEACDEFIRDIRRGKIFNGASRSEYDYDYLHVRPPKRIVSRNPSTVDRGFLYRTNTRFALNVQPQHRGSVVGCLVQGLFGEEDQVIASSMKTGGLHATNTRLAPNGLEYKQLDNIIVYTHSIVADKVRSLIHDCTQDIDGDGTFSSETIPMLNKVEDGLFQGNDNGRSFGNFRCEEVGTAAGLMSDYNLLDIFQARGQEQYPLVKVRELEEIMFPLFKMFVTETFVEKGIVRCEPSKLHR